MWAVDVEGDLIPSTVVYVVCAENLKTGQKVSLRDYLAIRIWFTERLSEGCRFVAHNGINYDFPTLNRIVGTRIPISAIIDSMVMSMVYSPSLEGGHSLGAWGDRLSYPKGEFNDFSKYSEEMERYCQRDVSLLILVYKALRNRMNKLKFTDVGLEIEHRSWELIRQQNKNGFFFNIQEAHILYGKLRGIEKDLTDKVHEYWPPLLEVVATYSKAFKKDGTPTSYFLQHSEQFVKVELIPQSEGYRAYDYVYFKIGSPQQRVQKLLELGWEPYDDEWTVGKKGPNKGKKLNPTPTKKGKLVPSLEKFVEDGGNEEVRLIARWIEINARANMVNTWIEAYNERTGCIHGRLWLANTLRYRHSDPNTANIPAVRIGKDDKPLLGEAGSYTYEARDLWTVRASDRRLVGVDAKGIQLRVLAHYLNNPAFTEAVLGGDPHSYNQQVGGFETRAISKTFIYAYLLGAGDAKVGQIISGSPREGRDVKKRFEDNFPGLKQLMASLQTQVDRTGRIILCDGTPLMVTKPHTRLGYLLQGDESRIMKKAAIEIATEVRKHKLDILKVCDVHDEHQYDCLKEHSEYFANEVCPGAFRRSGEFFDYRVPVDCSSMIGMTWGQTH